MGPSRGAEGSLWRLPACRLAYLTPRIGDSDGDDQGRWRHSLDFQIGKLR
jgi:hypothetical protein